MIVDFHTHIFPTRVAGLAVKNLSNTLNAYPFFDGTVEQLVENMKKNNIDYSVCMPVVTNPRHTISINDYAIEVNKKYNNIFSFGGIHPEYEAYEEEILRLKNNGIKGIKLHPVYQKMRIDDYRYINIINFAIKEGMYVLIHAGYDPGFPGDLSSCVDYLVNMLDSVEDTSKIILAHCGGLFEWNKVYEKIAGRDLYLDTAMTFGKLVKSNEDFIELIDNDLFMKILKKHGSDKILVGSDNPWTDSRKIIADINRLSLNNEEKDNMLWKNAFKILDLR